MASHPSSTESGKQLLIISHCPSPNTQALTQALLKGAQHPDLEDVITRVLSPFDCKPTHVMEADGLLLATTENFGYMSGAMKDFFDRIYYPCLELTQGRPYCLCVRAGNDGTGTINSVQRIVTGLKWRETQEPLLCRGDFQSEFLDQAEEYAMTMAAGLEAGIF